MGMIREPFRAYRLDEEKVDDTSKVIPVRLSKDELAWLESDGVLLNQEKLSTLIKQLMLIGHNCINEPETNAILDIVFNNKRKNLRLGREEVNPEFQQM
jgi:hypothetical protein